MYEVLDLFLPQMVFQLVSTILHMGVPELMESVFFFTIHLSVHLISGHLGGHWVMHRMRVLQV